MLSSALDHQRRSALVAQRAAREATKARGLRELTAVVGLHQVAQARDSEGAVQAMLAEQGDEPQALGRLQVLSFTTSMQSLGLMLDDATVQVGLLAASLVQDAGRAAESVAVAARPGVMHVRNVNPPCCSRCAVLAGRVYRYSEGFQRHPGCDCTMTPTTDPRSEFRQDPEQLARDGLVRGLSKADMQAIRDGADMGQVVNVRRKAAGMRESGRVITRAGRPSPEAIYRTAGDQVEAVRMLTDFGYLR